MRLGVRQGDPLSPALGLAALLFARNGGRGACRRHRAVWLYGGERGEALRYTSSPRQGEPEARVSIARGLRAATAEETIRERTAAVLRGLRVCGATRLADRMRRAEHEASEARRQALAFSSMCEVSADCAR